MNRMLILPSDELLIKASNRSVESPTWEELLNCTHSKMVGIYMRVSIFRINCIERYENSLASLSYNLFPSIFSHEKQKCLDELIELNGNTPSSGFLAERIEQCHLKNIVTACALEEKWMAYFF